MFQLSGLLDTSLFYNTLSKTIKYIEERNLHMQAVLHNANNPRLQSRNRPKRHSPHRGHVLTHIQDCSRSDKSRGYNACFCIKYADIFTVGTHVAP